MFPDGIIRLSLDFETFYDPSLKDANGNGYTLSSLSPAEYILHRYFEVIGAGVRFDTHPLDGHHGAVVGDYTESARYIDGPDLPKLFSKLPWERIAVVSHNGPFDWFILAHHYGHSAAQYVDTMAMARAFVFHQTGRVGLKYVAKALALPDKGDDVERMAGVTRAQLIQNPSKYANFIRYTCRDTNLNSWIVDHLGPRMPAEEWLILDMVSRMAIHPQLTLDTAVLQQHLAKVLADKAKVLEILKREGIITDTGDAKVDRASLMSNDKFAQLLVAEGIDPPRKISATTKKETWAFAKNDQEFTKLQEDDNPIVQALVSARLGVKSTQEETRTQRFIRVAALPWNVALTEHALDRAKALALVGNPGHFPMPFPLRYSGAHTHRLSGDWSWNLQNLGRKSLLRRALRAPKGWKIVSADASQIEARVVATLAKAMRLVNGFASGEDVYSTFASMVYGRAINKKDNPDERFVGKTGVLGLGFGMGPPKFVTTCYNQSPVDNRTRIGLDLGQKVVKTYRHDYAPEVAQYWDKMERVIDMMIRGEHTVEGPLTIMGQSIQLPNGMFLYYDGIHRAPAMRKIFTANGHEIEVESKETRFTYGGKTKYLFGGKLTENVVQALARICTMSAAAHIRRDLKVRFPLVGQVHDQLIYLVPESDAVAMAHVLVHAMRRPVPWLPDLPLEAEAGIGDNLLDLKEIKVPRYEHKAAA